MAVRIFDFLSDHWVRLNPKTLLVIAMTVLIAGLIYA